MREHRDRFFLATKTGERSYAGAREQIRRSLERLRRRPARSAPAPQSRGSGGVGAGALARRRAAQRAIEARDEGLVRFLGVTGHGTRVAAMHQRSLERFAVRLGAAPVQLLAAAATRSTRASSKRCSRSARERGVAVQTIKSIAKLRGLRVTLQASLPGSLLRSIVLRSARLPLTREAPAMWRHATDSARKIAADAQKISARWHVS